jgi:hypothetical protein
LLSEFEEANNYYIIHIKVDGPDLTPDKISIETQGGGTAYISQDPKGVGFVSEEISLPLGWDLKITFDVMNVGEIGQPFGTNVTFYNTSSLMGAPNATPFFETLPSWIFLDGKTNPMSDQTSDVGQTIIAQWVNPNIPGIWYINITIDPINNVPEFNEANNTFTLIINVSDFPATTLVPIGPSYSGSAFFVNSTTELDLNVTGGNPGFYTWYRIINVTTNVTVEDWKNYTAAGSTFNISWGEGTYRIDFNSTDSVGNVEQTRFKIVVVDDTKPQTEIMVGEPRFRAVPSHSYNITSTTPLLFSAVDLPLGESVWPGVLNASGIQSIHYRIQYLTNGSFVNFWTLIQNKGIIHMDGPLFSDGPYRIWFNSTDNLNHNETTQYLDVFLDNKGPISAVSVANPKQSHPLYDWFVSAFTDFTISSFESNGSGVNLSSIQIRIIYSDGGISSQWIFDSSFDLYSVFWLDDGNYTIEFRALDNLGNIGNSENITVYSDDSPPEIELTIKEPKYREFDTDLYNIYDFKLMNLKVKDGVGGWTVYFGEFNLSGLNHGPYYIELLAIDNLGNFQIQGTEVYLDTFAPNTSIAINDPKHRDNAFDIWNITHQTPITLTIDFDNGSGPQYIQYKITNSTYDSGWINYSGDFFLGLLFHGGEYSISYRGIDRLGNIENFKILKIILDNTGPESNIIISGSVYGNFVTSSTLFSKIADDNFGSGFKIIWHRIYGNDTGFYYTGWLSGNSFSLPANLIDGNYKIEFFAQDNLMNSGPTKSIFVFLDTTEPDSEISVLEPKYRLRLKDNWIVAENTMLSLQGQDGFGSQISAIYYSILNDVGIIVISSATYATPFNLSGLGGDGIYTIQYQAIDNLGHIGPQKEIKLILDSMSPQIISSQPSGSGNSVSSFIRITFSEDMDHEKLRFAFSYTNGSNIWNYTHGFFNWNKNTVTFYPFAKLQYGTEYTVSINTTASDIIGNRLDGNGDGVYNGLSDIFTLSFRTSEKIDKEPPSILNVTPSPNSIDVPYDTLIIIEFSEIMDEISVEAAFRYSDGNSIFDSDDGKFEWMENTTTFTPFESLEFDTQYTMTITGQARDILGNYISAGFLWRFTTQKDNLSPTIIGFSPSGNNIQVNTKITITFDEPMNSTITENAVILVPGINGSFEWNDNTLIFTPETDLKFSTKYFITVGIGLEDITGNSLELPFQFNFTTEPDFIPPQVIDHSPRGIEIGLDTDISITFNEAMNRTSVEDSLSISPLVSGVFTWSENTIIFHPEILTGFTIYTVIVSAQAKDYAENPMESLYQFSFTTKVDPYPPYIIEIAPLGEEVSVDSDIVIKFNEPMNLNSLQTAIIIIPKIGGSISTENELIIFSPHGKLAKGTKFNVTILNSAEDLSGNKMQSNFSWEFTTESDLSQISSPFAWDILFLGLFLVAIVIVLVLLFYEYIFKKKKGEEKVSEDDNVDVIEKPDENVKEHQIEVSEDDSHDDIIDDLIKSLESNENELD